MDPYWLYYTGPMWEYRSYIGSMWACWQRPDSGLFWLYICWWHLGPFTMPAVAQCWDSPVSQEALVDWFIISLDFYLNSEITYFDCIAFSKLLSVSAYADSRTSVLNVHIIMQILMYLGYWTTSFWNGLLLILCTILWQTAEETFYFLSRTLLDLLYV